MNIHQNVTIPIPLYNAVKAEFGERKLGIVVRSGLYHIINGKAVRPLPEMMQPKTTRQITINPNQLEQAMSVLGVQNKSYVIAVAITSTLSHGIVSEETVKESTNTQGVIARAQAARIAQQHGASIEELRKSDKYRMLEEHLMGLDEDEEDD